MTKTLWTLAAYLVGFWLIQPSVAAPSVLENAKLFYQSPGDHLEATSGYQNGRSPTLYQQRLPDASNGSPLKESPPFQINSTRSKIANTKKSHVRVMPEGQSYVLNFVSSGKTYGGSGGNHGNGAGNHGNGDRNYGYPAGNYGNKDGSGSNDNGDGNYGNNFEVPPRDSVTLHLNYPKDHTPKMKKHHFRVSPQRKVNLHKEGNDVSNNGIDENNGSRLENHENFRAGGARRGEDHSTRHVTAYRPRKRRQTVLWGAGLNHFLSIAGQWSLSLYSLFWYYLNDCPRLQSSGSERLLRLQLTQRCLAMGIRYYCDEINQKRQLPLTSPDSLCNVRTFAQIVFDNCCGPSAYQPPNTPQPILPPITVPPECGRYMSRTVPRIQGGYPAVSGEFPWIAGLLRYGYIVSCGTSIVSDRYVVTAAHCVTEPVSVYQVEAGLFHKDGTLDASVQKRRVSRVIVHPEYTTIGSLQINDIALVELETPFIFDDSIQQVCLPEADQPLPSYGLCTVAGWGLNSSVGSQPDVLYRVDLNVYDAQTCRQTFRKSSTVVRDTMVCAANGLVGGKDSCTGDSGGPLMCLQNNRWTMFGLVSMGNGCALPMEPGYYTSVPHFRHWIDSQITGRDQHG